MQWGLAVKRDRKGKKWQVAVRAENSLVKATFAQDRHPLSTNTLRSLFRNTRVKDLHANKLIDYDGREWRQIEEVSAANA